MMVEQLVANSHRGVVNRLLTVRVYSELVADQSSTNRRLNAKLLLNVQRLVGDHTISGEIVIMVAEVACKLQTKSVAER